MARVTPQDKADFQAALGELERLLRGNRALIDLEMKRIAEKAVADASKIFLGDPTGPNFVTATEAMEVMELFQ
jgi:hypothetical protein